MRTKEYSKNELALDNGLNEAYYGMLRAEVLLNVLVEAYLSGEIPVRDEVKAAYYVTYYEALQNGLTGILILLQDTIKEAEAVIAQVDAEDNGGKKE